MGHAISPVHVQLPIQSTRSWVNITTSNIINPLKQIFVNLQSYLSIELYSQFRMHFKASTIIQLSLFFFRMDLQHILTSPNHVVEVIFQIMIILTDHDKTITTLFLFYQLISVTFLTSNKLLNCKIARKPYTYIFKIRHVATELFCFTFVFFSWGENRVPLYSNWGTTNFIFIEIIWNNLSNQSN